MFVLVACEESQEVCKAFRANGHVAFSCDILPCSGGFPEWHIKSDVLPLLDGNCEFSTMDGVFHILIGPWDLIIAHPPCTFLSNAGARHLYPSGRLNYDRYNSGVQAAQFFLKFYDCNCPHICIENPVPSKIFKLPPCDQIIEPWQFGHPFQKRTCLWLKNLPFLSSSHICNERISSKQAAWFNKGGKYRQINRSKTFSGIAAAMADQWDKCGEYHNEQISFL